MAKPILFDMKESNWTEITENYKVMYFQGSDNMTIMLTEAHPEHEQVTYKIPHDKTIYIYGGECDYNVDGVSYHVDEGCYMHVPANVEHYIEHSGPSTVYELATIVPKMDVPASPKVIDRKHMNWDK